MSAAQSPVRTRLWAPAPRAGSSHNRSVRTSTTAAAPLAKGLLHPVPAAFAGRRDHGRHEGGRRNNHEGGRRSHIQPEGCPHYPFDKRPGGPSRPAPAPHGGGLPPASTHRSFPFRAGRSDSHMEVGVSVIVHDLVSPCQLDRARFTPVRAPHASRVTRFARPVCPVHGISHEDSSGWSVTPPPAPDTFTKRGAPVLLAAPVAAVLGGGVPPHGTRSEVVVRRAGGIGALAGSGPLSTGGPHEAAGMISFSCVRVGR